MLQHRLGDVGDLAIGRTVRLHRAADRVRGRDAVADRGRDAAEPRGVLLPLQRPTAGLARLQFGVERGAGGDRVLRELDERLVGEDRVHLLRGAFGQQRLAQRSGMCGQLPPDPGDQALGLGDVPGGQVDDVRCVQARVVRGVAGGGAQALELLDGEGKRGVVVEIGGAA